MLGTNDEYTQCRQWSNKTDMLIKMVLYMYSNWIFVQNYSPILVPTVLSHRT